MILHKECLPIERKWLDKQYCTPVVWPWEVNLTAHFGLEHIGTPSYTISIELVDNDGEPTHDITSSFDITIGQDADNKNVYVAKLREFPVIMPSNFRLLVTLMNEDAVVYREATEPYVFLNDQCITAYMLSSTDWGRIAAGRLVINGERIQVSINGTGLPSGFIFGINGARQEVSIACHAGLAYELYGEDAQGNRIELRNTGTICNKGNCSKDTILIEGVFDCAAPDGRFTGSVFPYSNDDPNVRYRYLTRIYADLLEMPAEITRTIALNNKVQRTERRKLYQLVTYEPMPGWQKEELETILMGARIFIQGQQYVFTTGRPFSRMGVPGTSTWWLKADLEELTERKDYSCEVVCLTCLKPTGLSYEILPVPCDPITSLQALVTAEDGGTVRLDISGANTSGASYFEIGYRIQGSGAEFTMITPNPVALPAAVTGLPNGIYEVQVIKHTADSVCPPLTAVSNATQLQEFDYLVVRYIWTDADGRDLDTFTGFINTGTIYDNDWVGYGQGDAKVPTGAADADAYLFWASDNTQSGVEAVMMNMKQFVEDNPGIATEIQVRMNAVWWSQRLTGDVQVQLTTYLGGTMSKNGFDFENTGGELVDQITLATNVATQSTSKDINNSTNVAIVRYNKNSKEATIQLV